MAQGNKNTYPFDASDIANPQYGTYTQEQKEVIAAEWNVNHEEVIAAKQAKADADAQKAIDRASAVSKLEALGLTSSEIDALTK